MSGEESRRARGRAARAAGRRDGRAPFGSALHVSGTDAQALDAAIAPFRDRPGVDLARGAGRRSRTCSSSLMQQAQDNSANETRCSAGRASSRCWRRSSSRCAATALTFAMMVGMPIMQLILFGFAINTDPKNLPTAVLDSRPRASSRAASSAALENSGYFRVTTGRPADAEADRLLADRRGPVRRHDPAGLHAQAAARRAAGAARRGRRDRPGGDANALAALLSLSQTALDARSRGAAGAPQARAAAVRAARPAALQPGGHHPVQHRAGPDRRRADDDDGDHDRAGGHARARARHDGEPARHAGAADRGDGRARSCRTSSSATCR